MHILWERLQKRLFNYKLMHLCARGGWLIPWIARIYINLGFNRRLSIILHSGVDEFKSFY